jgi:DNA-binding MarR family transcriptional regulator
MKNENYINIQGWMINELKLKGNELILYAIIYGFTQDGETEYKGSLSYLSESLCITKRCVINLLKSLVDKGLIMKIEDQKGNRFKVTGEKSSLVKKVHHTSEKSSPLGSEKSSPNNNNINNNNINTNDKVFLFSNSKFNDYETTKQYLAKNKKYIEKYRGVDLRYYIDAVDKWSDRKNRKTTDRGWMAYIREFMDKAIDNNNLVKLKQLETREEKIKRLKLEGNLTELARMGVNITLL